jgi:4a-hydroxytetrahydrobiopterin dehydratase
MKPLAEQHCRPLEGHPVMAQGAITSYLEAVDGWKFNDGAIEKTFRFPDYHHTMAFVNAVAWIAHREDHHPDIEFGYNHCTLRFITQSIRGISLNDFICAAKVDALTA